VFASSKGSLLFACAAVLYGLAWAGPVGGTFAVSARGHQRTVLQESGPGSFDDSMTVQPGLQAALMPTATSVLQLKVEPAQSGQSSLPRIEGTFAGRSAVVRLARHNAEVTADASGVRIPTKHADAQVMHYPDRLGVGMALHRATLPTASRWSQPRAAGGAVLVDPSAQLTSVGLLVRRDPLLEWLRGSDLTEVGLAVADAVSLTLGGEVQAGIGSVRHSLLFEHTVRADSDVPELHPSTFLAFDATLELGVLMEREVAWGRLWAHTGLSARVLRTGPAMQTGSTNEYVVDNPLPTVLWGPQITLGGRL